MQTNGTLINKDKILELCLNSQVPCKTAMRIAECESQYGKYPYNWEKSSALGIYQFTTRTWNNYCKGEVLNMEDNIKCFLKLYPKHPNWWKCS